MSDQTHNADPQPAWTGRLPAGLVISMMAMTGSLAAMLICWNLRWPTDNHIIFIAHTAAGLCAVWGIVIHGLTALRPRFAVSPLGRDLLAVLQIVQMTFGLLAIIILFYLAVSTVFIRIPSLPFFNYARQLNVPVPAVSAIDLGLIGVALLLAWWRTGNGFTITCLLWTGVLAALWASLQIADTAVREVNGISREVWVDWVSTFVLGVAVTVAGLTCLRELLAHRRRVAAWPDRLDDLFLPPPAWPGFRYSAGIVSAMVLVLGCMMIVSPLTPISAFLTGISMLVLAHRRWDENFADAALGLITLGVLSLLMPTVHTPASSQAEHFAAIFCRAILGLAVMTAFWHWMAAVWTQQLDNGRAWTTAGRLIRPCRRVGFLLGATGVLVSLHLAFWPKLPFVDQPDNSLSRWIWGIGPNLLLIASLAGATRRTGKTTLAWLTVFAIASMVAFVANRLPGGAVFSFLLKHWPLLLAATAGLLLVLARRCWASPGTRPFFEPTYINGVLVLPMAAISGASLIGSHAIPPWMGSATFATLTVTYLLAAFVTGPRRFIVLAIVCAAAAAVSLPGI